MDGLRSELESLRVDAEASEDLVARVRSDMAAGADVSAALASLDALDQRILTSASRDVAGVLVQDVAHEVLDSDASEKDAEDVLDRSTELYAALSRSAAYHLREIDRLSR